MDGTDPLAPYTLTFDRDHLAGRTFALGNRAAFLLYLPVANNIRDRTLHATKWFGASGFGRTFFAALPAAADGDGRSTALDRRCQTGFEMRLDGATRVFGVGDQEVRESFFVPNGMQAFVVTLEGAPSFTLKPEFDMRYYQDLNSDFSRYAAETGDGLLLVRNTVLDIGPNHDTMEFYAAVGAAEGSLQMAVLPPEQRLVAKTYLKDEHRSMLIHSVYAQTQAQAPDEAPAWDRYDTQVYAPARLQGDGPLTLIFAFGDRPEEARAGLDEVRSRLPDLRREKRGTVAARLEEARFETGDRDVDLAHAHVLTRFDDCLVARDAELHIDPVHQSNYNAVFAGNKYFLDAWKRDENISLEALLATNDLATARAILDSTWQHQDPRTGRLPHIIRAGEPLVYYSSDGTLWALRRLWEYTRDSGDTDLLQAKAPMVRHFFEVGTATAQRGLLPSGGVVDKDYLWETWEDTPFTPRAGFPIEIELLWLTALADYLPLVGAWDPALGEVMAATLEQGRQTFALFVHGGYLVDGLTYDWAPNAILTPNFAVAFGLNFPLDPALAHDMVLLSRDQLAGRRGVRSLAPRDWPSVLPAAWLADPHSHEGKNMASVGIFNYHRGIEWEWFNPFFVQGELECGDVNRAFALYVQGQVHQTLHEAGIGGLSELYDLHGPLGADFQAWSMAGFIESLHGFAGVRVDAGARLVQVRPSLPDLWPSLRCRRQMAVMRFDLTLDRIDGGVRLTLAPLGPVPPDTTLEVGFRADPHRGLAGAWIDGQEDRREKWTPVPRCGDGATWLTRRLPLRAVQIDMLSS